MFDVPINSTLDCSTYFKNPGLNIPKFLVTLAISQCIENVEEGRGGGFGVDLFITSVANEYYTQASQIMVIYDESWDITDMLVKLESSTQKSFVTYYLPLNTNKSLHTTSRPPDHITHKLLPKGTAFIVFVKNQIAFSNILDTMGNYPWWSKRARFLIMVKDKAFEPTKGILEVLESQMIFNGVVVTEFVIKENSTEIASELGVGTSALVPHVNSTESGTSGMELQIVALDPYPIPGHSKRSFVARWKGSDYTSIVRPIFQEKIDNLRGNTLRACVFDFPPLVIKTEISPGNFTYSGQEVKIFQEFANLLNFTYEFFEPPNGTRVGLNLGENNWTGLIGEVQAGADFGFANVFLLDNREQAVDVSNPYDQDSGCFAVPKPENLQNWIGLILPFSWQVWACVLAMAFVAGPIFSFITRPLNMDKSMSVGRGIFYAMGSLVSAQKAPKAKSHSLRTFIVVWLIFCWLSFILYRVALIVSLTTGPSSYRIDYLKQLVRSGLEWGGYIEVLKTYSNITESTKSTGEEKSDKKMFDRFIEVSNMTEALDRVSIGEFAVLDSRKFLLYKSKGVYFDGYSSSIHIMKECASRYNVGFAMPIGSPFLDRINEIISRLQSAGLIDKWLQDILHEAAIKIPSKDRRRKRERALSLDNMKLCYIIFFGGHFCAFLTCCVENAIQEYKSRKGLEILLRLARKISIISLTAMTPSFLITDTGLTGDKNNCNSETNLRKHSFKKEPNGEMDRLQPPPNPDAVMAYDDDQEE